VKSTALGAPTEHVAEELEMTGVRRRNGQETNRSMSTFWEPSIKKKKKKKKKKKNRVSGQLRKFERGGR